MVATIWWVPGGQIQRHDVAHRLGHVHLRADGVAARGVDRVLQVLVEDIGGADAEDDVLADIGVQFAVLRRRGGRP